MKPEVEDLIPYRHDHPPVRNVNRLSAEQMTWGERLSDRLTDFLGSWTFIIWQTAILAGWIVLNAVAWAKHWDPYPFIFLNLVLNFQESFAAPIIMMSQNRGEKKDRLRAEEDFRINVKAENEVALVLRHLEAQRQEIAELKQMVARLSGEQAPD